MKFRYSYLIACLACIALCFYAANKSDNSPAYVNAALIITIVSLSITALSLAFFTIKTLGLLHISRSSIFVNTVILALNFKPTLIMTCILLGIILNVICFSEKFLTRVSIDVGNANEDMFILKSPTSVILWFVLVWGIFWSLFSETIHLFAKNNSVQAVITLVIAVIVGAIFITPQLRIFLRRSVIVPNGIVIADSIEFTDVILLPLAKIKSIEMVKSDDIRKDVQDNIYVPTTIRKRLINISLNEKTDSLIVRNKLNETSRKNVDSLYLCLADPKLFLNNFHSRFHKVDPEPLSKSEEKIMEKQLGIETAPRSDSPLPQHRKKKSK
ncbi:MAG: hypothetical protein U0R17_06575 [Acidimicrobiia bacterium]